VSIEETDVIDIISTDSTSGQTVLTIADHLDWSESGKHLLLLQQKLNRYLAFIESGEILEHRPYANLARVVIKISFKYQPDNAGRDFLNTVRPIIESAGFVLVDQVYMGPSIN